MNMILASNNPHKLREFREILEPLGCHVISQEEAGIHVDPEETGETFEENSAIKARAVYEIAKCAVIADDSGLEVDALGGEPGVHSARYGGTRDDKTHNDLVLKKLEGVPDEKRTARFVCAITYIDENGVESQFLGKFEGRIGYEELGENGFGYDPIFMVGDVSSAELSPDEKNAVSHRGKALRMLAEFIKERK
jgi:XTP/dITP diphosphohydrolase